MAGLDLGKQIGPLPLGAWIAVVGVGGGIAWYTRRSGGEPTIVEDTSGTPGVGVGGMGPFIPVTPESNAGGGIAPPTTNEEWGRRAVEWLTAYGMQAMMAQQAVSKYLSGVKLSAQEFSLIGLALVGVGPLPQALPPVPDETTEPDTTPTTAPFQGGNHVDAWIADVNDSYGVGLTKLKLRALNPNIPIRGANDAGFTPNAMGPATRDVFSTSGTAKIR